LDFGIAEPPLPPMKVVLMFASISDFVFPNSTTA